MIQDSKIKRFIVVSVILVFICLICIFVSVRSVERYSNKIAETEMLKQKLDNLEQDFRNLDIKNKELEVRRQDLSWEKEQISKEYITLKDKYAFLGKTIETLERDVNTLRKVIERKERYEEEAGGVDKDDDETESLLSTLQSENDQLLKELADKTKEKMILEIALKAQANRLGLTEEYDPDLKEILKKFVTSLQ